MVKLVSLICDTLFIIIIEKLILTLVCIKNDQKILVLLIDNNIQCWNNENYHQIISTINLILLGYFIPMSTMIAPMFDELKEVLDYEMKQKEKKKSFWDGYLLLL